jgi:hypothetical protein
MKQKLTKSEIETLERNRFYSNYGSEDIRAITIKLVKANQDTLTNDEKMMHEILMTKEENFVKNSEILLIMMESLLSGFISQNPTSKTEMLVYLQCIKNAIVTKR